MHRVKDMELVQVKCDDCGTLFDIKYGTYRKTKTKPHYCRACRGKRESNRIKSLSADEKKAYLNKKNKAISAGWAKQSKEKKQQISQDRISKWDEIHDRNKLSNELTMKWENMTEEEKKIHFDRLSKGREEYWKDESTRAYHSERARDKWYKQTEEEKERILKAAMDGYRNWYDSLSDEEFDEHRNSISDGLYRHWAGVTDDYRKAASERSKAYWDSLTEEEMNEYRYQCEIRSKQRWANMTDEERAEIREKSKTRWANMSEEEKLKTMIPTWKGWQNWWDNLPEYKKAMKIETMNIASKDWYNNLSNAEREEYSKKKRLWWENLSEEQKELISQNNREKSLDWWRSLSDDDLINISIRSSNVMKEYWKNLPEDEKRDRIRILTDGFRNWWDNLTTGDFEEYGYKQSIGVINNSAPNKNENDFMDMLKINGINHKFLYLSTKKHPDFEKLFPYNPVTNTPNVFPYHKWDFIVHTREKDILIDIDGSIHDSTQTNNHVAYGKKYIILKDLIQFNDSKRPYQTDGLEAYIIKCYDDKLTYNTIVESIDGKEKYTLFQFITILKMYNGYKVIQ